MCPLEGGNKEVMVCNASTAQWPDVQMHFDGCRTSAAAHPTLQNQSTLQMVAHPCDMDYLHLSVDGKRLQVCSGYQGQPVASNAYLSYELEGPVFITAEANATYWMRTYEETTDLLHVGNLLQNDPALNNTLGFLGGDANSSNPVLAGLASGDAKFFRCADRIACQMPEYTYGGATMDPRRWAGSAGVHWRRD